MSINGEMERLIILTFHLRYVFFVPNECTEGPLEGHRGFAVLPFLHLEFFRNLRVHCNPLQGSTGKCRENPVMKTGTLQ